MWSEDEAEEDTWTLELEAWLALLVTWAELLALLLDADELALVVEAEELTFVLLDALLELTLVLLATLLEVLDMEEDAELETDFFEYVLKLEIFQNWLANTLGFSATYFLHESTALRALPAASFCMGQPDAA
jgi:hypothetical protein